MAATKVQEGISSLVFDLDDASVEESRCVAARILEISKEFGKRATVSYCPPEGEWEIIKKSEDIQE